MTEIQNLNKHAIICMIIFLLMVLFFLQLRVFSQLFQTILGRAFLVILIIYITYCNQIGGVLFVLFLMIMHTNDSTVEGLSLRNNVISNLSEKLKEEERNQAAVDAMASVNGSSDPHKIFLKSAATIAQDYNNENPNPPFFSIMPAKIKLLEEVRAAKAANSPSALATAQLNYLESLATIAEKIANSKPFSKESVAFKKAKQAETEASIKAEPRPMASSVRESTSPSSFAPTSTVNAAPVTVNAAPAPATPSQEVLEKAGTDAIDSIEEGQGNKKSYQTINARNAQDYVKQNPNSGFDVTTEQIKLVSAVNAAKSPDEVKQAQLNYVETLSKIGDNIAAKIGTSAYIQWQQQQPRNIQAMQQMQQQEQQQQQQQQSPGEAKRLQDAIANPNSPDGILLKNYIKENPNTPEARAYAAAYPESPEALAISVNTPTPTPLQVVPEPTATSSVTQVQAREDAKNLIKTLTPTPTQSDTSILTQIKKTFTCTENFKPLEGFDLLGLEDNMKRGKQSNSIQVGNSYHQNSEDVMPYEKSFFSPFHF